MKLTDVIRRPLITEKTSILREDGRTIVFQVATGANKIEIKRAVEQLLGSKVEGIRTSIAHGKIKRDPAQRAKFVRTHPCPSTGKTHGPCPGYVVDHVRALKRGGRDDPSNMQWQTLEAARAKDRWE